MIQLEGVSKIYRTADGDKVPALHDINLSVGDGEMVAILGQSGSGVSTLLNILSCLDLPSSGRYLLDGKDLGRLSKRGLAKARGRTVGFVIQSFDLISDATVGRNVELPLLYTRAKVRQQRAKVALDRVGLRGHYDDMPVELFTAQRQKAVIARALINDPRLLLDDDPTRDLDAESAGDVMELFTELNEAGLTVIYSSHDEATASYARRIVRLRGGRIVSDRANAAQSPPRRQPPKLKAV